MKKAIFAVIVILLIFTTLSTAMFFIRPALHNEREEAVKTPAGSEDANSASGPAGMQAIGRDGEQDDAKAMEWYLKAAEQGNAEAQYELGVMYYNGRGAEQDYEEAFKWYLKAAEQGHARAQLNLALMNCMGQGAAKDIIECYKWAILSAEQGVEEAVNVQLNLKGSMESYQIYEAKRRARAFAERKQEK